MSIIVASSKPRICSEQQITRRNLSFVRGADGGTLIKRIFNGFASTTLSIALITVCPSVANAQMNADVKSTFALKCAGCHMGGGNVVQADATLFLSDMERNGYLDVDKLYNLVYYGKGKMPGFGQECAPKGKCTFGKRSSDEEIQQLGGYVLEEAKNNWQK
eukprot:TRINITY_DN689_c0_g1_i1.p5 TRINITY_DN689_c0_g1~~TRINITY_DN689_c0_g1_i1.p5  ORF type:complete len:161 (-),score=18.92 TRINITY_DN689_c0_g1_i1:528-1010(-)